MIRMESRTESRTAATPSQNTLTAVQELSLTTTLVEKLLSEFNLLPMSGLFCILPTAPLDHIA